MQTPTESQAVVDFVRQHYTVFGSAAGSIVAFGFIAGRYVFDKQLNILKEANGLLKERLDKALADLEQKNKESRQKDDPLKIARIKDEKAASDRGAALRFALSAVLLLILCLSGATFYFLNDFSVREAAYRDRQAARQDALEAEITQMHIALQQKAIPPASVKKRSPRQDQNPTDSANGTQ